MMCNLEEIYPHLTGALVKFCCGLYCTDNDSDENAPYCYCMFLCMYVCMYISVYYATPVYLTNVNKAHISKYRDNSAIRRDETRNPRSRQADLRSLITELKRLTLLPVKWHILPTDNSRPFEDDTTTEGSYVLAGDSLFNGLKTEILCAIKDRHLPRSIVTETAECVGNDS